MKPGKLKKEIELPLLVLVLLFFVTPVLIYLPAMESVVLPKSVFIAVMTAFLVAIVLLQPGRWMPRSMEAFRTALDVQVLAVIATSALSLWLAGGSVWQEADYVMLVYGVVLVYLLVCFFRVRPEWAGVCRRTLFAAASVVALYVVVQDYGYDVLPWSKSGPDWRFQLPGTMGNPNAVAGFLAVLLPVFVMEFYLTNTVSSRIPAALGLMLVFMALVVTFSAGAWLGIVAGGAVALWYLRREESPEGYWRKWTLVVALLLSLFFLGEIWENFSFMASPFRYLGSAGGILAGFLLLAAVGAGVFLLHKRFHFSWTRVLVPPLLLLIVMLFYFTPNPINGREGSILDQAAASSRWRTGSGARRFIWKTTALMVQDHPLSGIGFGNYYKEHSLYQGLHYRLRGTAHDRPTTGQVPQVHNEYYQQAAETGLFGFLALLWLVFALIGLWPVALRRASSSREKALLLALVAGLAVFLVHALSSFPLRRPSTWLAGAYLVAALVARVDPLKKEESGAALPQEEGSKDSAGLHPALRVLILAMLVLQTGMLVRPLIGSVYLQQAMSPVSLPRERVESIQKALAWAPEDFQARFMAAVMALQASRPEAAVQLALEAVRIRDDLQAWRLISDAYQQMGQLEKSAEAWDRVLVHNPCYPPFLEEGARRWAEAGHPDRAGQLMQQALDLKENEI
jgi:O-antigen ligase